MSEQQIEQRTCRFPGCQRPVVAAEGTGAGRPPEYCDDPGHNRAAAWRARRRLSPDQPTRTAEEEKRPVDSARQRASEIRAQVAGIAEHLGQQMSALVEELRTVADPEAVEAQIETVTIEAAEQVASASARASRAEQAQRQAEAERAEADAAAVEASELAEQQQASLVEAGEHLALQGEALDQVRTELAETQTAGETRNRQAQNELAQLREQLATTHLRLTETEQARVAVSALADAATTARAEADERARGAVAHASAEEDRATRAEAETIGVREQLDQARAEREELHEELSVLRRNLATVTVEREAARADAAREMAHGDQRVADLRISHDQQLGQLRADLTEARQDARDQQSRADKSDTHR